MVNKVDFKIKMWFFLKNKIKCGLFTINNLLIIFSGVVRRVNINYI